MSPADRYDTSTLPEYQFESGSDGTVLKNLLGITSREEMEDIETEHLWRAQAQLLGEIEPDQQLTAHTIPSTMTTFERDQLGHYTPCRFASQDEIALSLAEVHTELMLIPHRLRLLPGTLHVMFII